MWHPFSSRITQSPADLTRSVASDCVWAFLLFFMRCTCTLTRPHCSHHGHILRLVSWSCGRSATVLLLLCLKPFHLSFFSQVQANSFFFLYTRNTFFVEKLHVINNFHITTIDLPLYAILQKSDGGTQSPLDLSCHFFASKSSVLAAFSHTPPWPSHKHHDCPASSDSACRSSCRVHNRHHWLGELGFKTWKSIASIGWGCLTPFDASWSPDWAHHWTLTFWTTANTCTAKQWATMKLA